MILGVIDEMVPLTRGPQPSREEVLLRFAASRGWRYKVGPAETGEGPSLSTRGGRSIPPIGPAVVSTRRWNKEWASFAMDLAQDRRTWSAAVRDTVYGMDADSARAG